MIMLAEFFPSFIEGHSTFSVFFSLGTEKKKIFSMYHITSLYISSLLFKCKLGREEESFWSFTLVYSLPKQSF